jgi:hypothetical protein
MTSQKVRVRVALTALGLFVPTALIARSHGDQPAPPRPPNAAPQPNAPMRIFEAYPNRV